MYQKLLRLLEWIAGKASFALASLTLKLEKSMLSESDLPYWNKQEELNTSARVSENYSIMAGIWALLAVLRLWTTNVRNPIPSFVAIGLIASGACFGIGFGAVFAKRQLSNLEKKRQSRWSLQKTLYLVGGLSIIAGFMFLLPAFISYPTLNSAFAIVFDLFLPFLPASLATEAYLFRDWERKHKKHIMSRIWFGGLYVYP